MTDFSLGVFKFILGLIFLIFGFLDLLNWWVELIRLKGINNISYGYNWVIVDYAWHI